MLYYVKCPVCGNVDLEECTVAHSMGSEEYSQCLNCPNCGWMNKSEDTSFGDKPGSNPGAT
jgi:sarcosine oxidase delta subunit